MKIYHLLPKIRRDIIGADKGFVSSIFYLKNNKKYNIFLDRFEVALKILIPNLSFQKTGFEGKYREYNRIVNRLKRKYCINPQEIDIILTVISYW